MVNVFRSAMATSLYTFFIIPFCLFTHIVARLTLYVKEGHGSSSVGYPTLIIQRAALGSAITLDITYDDDPMTHSIRNCFIQDDFGSKIILVDFNGSPKLSANVLDLIPVTKQDVSHYYVPMWAFAPGPESPDLHVRFSCDLMIRNVPGCADLSCMSFVTSSSADLVLTTGSTSSTESTSSSDTTDPTSATEKSVTVVTGSLPWYIIVVIVIVIFILIIAIAIVIAICFCLPKRPKVSAAKFPGYFTPASRFTSARPSRTPTPLPHPTPIRPQSQTSYIIPLDA